MEYNLYYAVSNKTVDNVVYVSCILYQNSTEGLPWIKELIEHKCEPKENGSDLFFIGLMKATEWLKHLNEGRFIHPNSKVIINSTHQAVLSALKKQDFTKTEKNIVRRLRLSHKYLENSIDIYYREIGKNDNIAYLYLRQERTKRNLIKVKSNDFKIEKKERQNKIRKWEVKI